MDAGFSCARRRPWRVRPPHQLRAEAFGRGSRGDSLRRGGRTAGLAAEQKPYGVMLSCIDPRVPPELLFDTWIGEHADPVDAMTRVHIKQTSADLRATPISPLS